MAIKARDGSQRTRQHNKYAVCYNVNYVNNSIADETRVSQQSLRYCSGQHPHGEKTTALHITTSIHNKAQSWETMRLPSNPYHLTPLSKNWTAAYRAAEITGQTIGIAITPGLIIVAKTVEILTERRQ